MYDVNTMRILFRFSQIPITVYTSEWKKLDRFTSFYKEPDTFESKMMQTLKENMAEKRFYFVAYDAHVPIALCGCRGEEEYFVLGPFSYGLTNTFECRNFIRKNRIRECPKCRLEDILALVSFLTGEEFQEERRKDILGEFLPDREERENQELVTR